MRSNTDLRQWLVLAGAAFWLVAIIFHVTETGLEAQAKSIAQAICRGVL